MSILSENVIPGNHGLKFGTNAILEDELVLLQSIIADIPGIKSVIINFEVFPRELTVHTSKLVKIKTIEEEVHETGFSVVPKDVFEL